MKEFILTKKQVEKLSKDYKIVEHGVSELLRAGIAVGDTNESIPIGDYIIDLLATYAKQRHTPLTLHVTFELFINLANGWSLTPLTLGEEEFVDLEGAIDFNRRDKRILRIKDTKTIYNQEAYICQARIFKDFDSNKLRTAPKNTITQNGTFYIHDDGKATGQVISNSSCVIIPTDSYKVPEPVVLPVIAVEYEKGQYALFCEKDDNALKQLYHYYDMRIAENTNLKDKDIMNITFADLFATNDGKEEL